MLSRLGLLVACVAGVLWSSAMAAAQTAPLRSEDRPVVVDSGIIRAPARGAGPQVMWSEIVAVEGAPWLRLKFDEVMLGENKATGAAAFLRITSFDDAAVQTMHARHMPEWGNTSAYFNGDAVLVELLAFPGAGASRVRMSEVTAGLPPVEPDEICGRSDDRVPSSDPRSARLLPAGCTGWMINDCNHCFLSAGHCVGGFDVVQFNVPLSSSGGALRHPGPEDQYALDETSVLDDYSPIGNDWTHFGAHPNSTTGLTPFETQGSAYDLAAAAPAVGSQSLRITGYGTTGAGVPPEWNQVQKTHAGPYTDKSGTIISYRIDTTDGNSGSAVIDLATGLAIGIHTNGGCTATGGANLGTAIEHRRLQAALRQSRGVCCFAKPTIVTNFDVGVGGGTSFGSGSSVASKAFGFTMADDYALSAAILSMNFPEPQPEVDVSIWSGASAPQTHLVTLLNPRNLSGGGNFRFTPPSALTLEGGQTYWLRVAADTPGGGPAFTWVGTSPSTLPSGYGASAVGFVGAPRTVHNRLELEGRLAAGTPLETAPPNNGSGGVFMNLTNLGDPVRITSFEVAYEGTVGEPVDVEVWTRPVTYVGFDHTSIFAWTLTQTVQGVKRGPSALSPLKLTTPIVIDGATGVYLHATGRGAGGIRYSGTSFDPPRTSWGNVDLDLFSDVARTGLTPFGGSRFTPRAFAGVIHYDFGGCYADCDESGALDFFDFLCFQNQFAAGEPYADCDESGGLDFFDFLCFQNEFAAGCS